MFSKKCSNFFLFFTCNIQSKILRTRKKLFRTSSTWLNLNGYFHRRFWKWDIILKKNSSKARLVLTWIAFKKAKINIENNSNKHKYLKLIYCIYSFEIFFHFQPTDVDWLSLFFPNHVNHIQWQQHDQTSSRRSRARHIGPRRN